MNLGMLRGLLRTFGDDIDVMIERGKIREDFQIEYLPGNMGHLVVLREKYGPTTKELVIGEPTRPVPMILYCSACLERHVDKGEFATKPHHTHACQRCGFVWRPAVVDTVGVQFLPGFKDTEDPV